MKDDAGMLDWLDGVLFAHRGLHGPNKPENSIAAVDAAVSKGYGIELDLQLTADGRVAVFHDDTLNRMTGKPGSIGDYTAAELQQTQLRGLGQQSIPLLNAVLAMVRGRVPLYLELKPAGPVGALEAAVAAMLSRYKGPVLIASFQGLSLNWMAEHAPQLPRCLIIGTCPPGPLGEAQHRRERWHYKLSAPHAVSVDCECQPDAWVARLGLQDVPLITWTLKTPAALAAARTWANAYVFEGFLP
ncbi:glycerophosphodiester phosphodiesterase [Oceanidesulfovibrio marinus]|uniref:Glycerophosphodiester phosphodiesterase n=2 Tax=Oceanidesulfovibrio marinus TaxID=370038 RepID=A0ABX6NCG4_9BACT|nr:glycerophosphodiester phosphodiesterase [Oceanidesulfovibrio marinus]